MRLLNLVTNHQKTGKIEIRCDPERLNTLCDEGAEVLRVQTIRCKRRNLLKRSLAFITLVVLPYLALGQIRSTAMQDEVLKLEKEFSEAIVKNVERIGLVLPFFRDRDLLGFPIHIRNRHRPERHQVDSWHEFGKKRRQKLPVPSKKVHQQGCDTEIEHIICGRQSAFYE